MQRDFKGIWIPANIWLSKELTLQEKVFYVEIQSLDNGEGCYASNAYFAEFFEVSINRAGFIIGRLVSKGLIQRTTSSKTPGKRLLKVSRKKAKKPAALPVMTRTKHRKEETMPKGGGDRCLKEETPRCLKEEDNNTVFNNTINKNLIKTFSNNYTFFKMEFSTIWTEEFIPLKKKKKASVTERALTSQLNKIQTYSKGDYDTALQILERSVNAGWADFYAPPVTQKYKPQLAQAGSRASGHFKSTENYSRIDKVIH